ncbi:MAG: pilin [Candidatus Pacebacteria bacterium]|nr:pilin [Candidatus Paceibacterota bacterium]
MIKKEIKIFSILAAIFFLFPVADVLALETKFPPITIGPGKVLSITGASTLPEFVAYFYAFIVGIGAVAAFFVLVFAGFEFVLSYGDPKRISQAKGRARNALIGVAVLVASFLVLNAITPKLTTPENIEIDCSKVNVCVEKIKTTPDGEIKQVETSFQDSPNLGLASGEKINIKQFNGLKEAWGFAGIDYSGAATLLYRDNSDADLNSQLTAPFTIGDNIKSVKIYKKQAGIYLYDAPNYGANALPPRYLSNSVPDLGDFKNKIKSVWVMGDVKGNKKYYYAIFSAVNYNNTNGQLFCGVFGQSKAAGLPAASGSLAVFEEPYSPTAVVKGTITFYNNLSCGESDSAEVRKCEIQFSENYSISPKSVDGACPELGGDKILSFKINGSAAVLLDSGNACHYWNSSASGEGNCIKYSSLLYSNKAISFIIIPFIKFAY